MERWWCVAGIQLYDSSEVGKERCAVSVECTGCDVCKQRWVGKDGTFLLRKVGFMIDCKAVYVKSHMH